MHWFKTPRDFLTEKLKKIHDMEPTRMMSQTICLWKFVEYSLQAQKYFYTTKYLN